MTRLWSPVRTTATQTRESGSTIDARSTSHRRPQDVPGEMVHDDSMCDSVHDASGWYAGATKSLKVYANDIRQWLPSGFEEAVTYDNFVESIRHRRDGGP